jgi:hypothetical protein
VFTVPEKSLERMLGEVPCLVEGVWLVVNDRYLARWTGEKGLDAVLGFSESLEYLAVHPLTHRHGVRSRQDSRWR